MARKRRGKFGGHFALIPEEVMASEAWRTLTHSQRTTLTVLAVQYHGEHNGVQVLTRKLCQKYGINHSQATRDAKVLVARGLVEKVYQARYKAGPQRRVPSLYALGWHKITHRNNWPLERPEDAPNLWAEWTSGEIPSLRSTQQSASHSAAVSDPNCCVLRTEPPKTAAQSANLLRSRVGIEEKPVTRRRATG